MFTRKPQTILTARLANAKAANKKRNAFMMAKEAELTSPAEVRNGLLYVTIAGLTMPTNK